VLDLQCWTSSRADPQITGWWQPPQYNVLFACCFSVVLGYFAFTCMTLCAARQHPQSLRKRNIIRSAGNVYNFK
jgi:hypothetical protein